MWDAVKDVLRRFGGRIGGSAAGLTVAILFLTLGFFRTLLILVCVGVGFAVGMLVDDREAFLDMMGKLMPKSER